MGVQPKSGIQAACDKMGSQAQLADALDVTQQAVSLWVNQGYAPRHRVAQIAALTGINARSLYDPSLVNDILG